MKAEIMVRPKQKVQVDVTTSKDLIYQYAHQKGWDGVFQIGRGKMVKKAVTMEDWCVFPLEKYPHKIPEEGLDRVAQLSWSSIPIEGFLVLDEKKDFQLKPPPDPKKRFTIPPIMWGFVFATTAKILLYAVAAVAAAIVGIILLALVVTVGAALLVCYGVLAALTQADPYIVAVTPEHEYIAIYEW